MKVQIKRPVARERDEAVSHASLTRAECNSGNKGYHEVVAVLGSIVKAREVKKDI